jgi:hypothetical protein
MKLGNRKIEGPNVEIVVIPRPSYREPVLRDGQPVFRTGADGEPEKDAAGNPIPETVEKSGDLVFKLQAVLDSEEFDALVSIPEPPVITVVKTGEKRKDFEDREYKKALTKRQDQYTNWMILKSLEATPGLEWEDVDMKDPSTWGNYIEEFRKAGLSTVEVNRILNAMTIANGLDQSKFDEAKRRFLAGQGAMQPEDYFRHIAPISTRNGEHVKDSA